IWIRDIARNVESRFTFESSVQARPAWFPSGRRLAYAEGAAGESRLVGRNADGSGGTQTLGNGFLPNISQNGKYVTYLVDDRLRYSEVLPDGSLGPATGVLKSTPEPLVLAAALSPDGSFVAYAERQPDRRLD